MRPRGMATPPSALELQASPLRGHVAAHARPAGPFAGGGVASLPIAGSTGECASAGAPSSPMLLAAQPRTPNSTPLAQRAGVPAGSGGGGWRFAHPQPLNHINLAAQLAQLDFGRSNSPLGLPGGTFSVSPSPSAADSPLYGAIRPYDQTPVASPAAMRASPFAPLRDRHGLGLAADRHHRRSDSTAELTRARSEGSAHGDHLRRSGDDANSSRAGCGSGGGGGEVVIDISPAINPYLLHYATPAPPEGGVVRCRVLRSRGKKRHISYRMLTDAGDELLTAVRKADDFWISMTSSELLLPDEGSGRTADWAKAQKSSFSVLRCPPESAGAPAEHEQRLFFAYKAAYNGRELIPTGEPIIAISHGTVVAAAELPQVNTMRACFPNPAEGAPLCTRAYLIQALDAIYAIAGADGERGGAHGAPRERVPGGVCALNSRVPVWNARTESYVLNFHGRATLASSKNVQLVHWEGGSPPHVGETDSTNSKELPTLLYGKVDRDTYNLDYKFPLSAYHAFVIAISVTDW